MSSKSSKLAIYFDKKFNNERHCTRQYVLNLFPNVHGWFSAGIICFLGLEIRLVKVIVVTFKFTHFQLQAELLQYDIFFTNVYRSFDKKFLIYVSPMEEDGATVRMQPLPCLACQLPVWCSEVEFLEEIQTEVLRVFLLAIHRHLY